MERHFVFTNFQNLAINFLERDLEGITRKVAMVDVNGIGRVMTSGHLFLHKRNTITENIFKNQYFFQN